MGLYLPGDGFLHRLHPLTKLALAAASFFLAFADLLVVRGVLVGPWFLVALFIALSFADGVETGRVVARRFVLLLLPIVISLFLVQGFFFPGAEQVIARIGPFSLKQEGLIFGATILARLALVLSAALLTVVTTHPADLTQALTQVGVPREMAYVILAALQLVPRMQARAQAITHAQQARGLRTEGNLFVRVRALLPLVGPLLTSALHEAEERALALEARAFRAPGPKTSWRELRDSPAQRLLRWVIVLLSIALFVWARL